MILVFPLVILTRVDSFTQYTLPVLRGIGWTVGRGNGIEQYSIAAVEVCSFPRFLTLLVQILHLRETMFHHRE